MPKLDEDAPLASCEAKHTKYNPPIADFRCPKCDAECGDFYSADSPNFECPALHVNDTLECAECGYVTTGAKFSTAFLKKANLVTCSACKGKGVVAAAKVKK